MAKSILRPSRIFLLAITVYSAATAYVVPTSQQRRSLIRLHGECDRRSLLKKVVLGGLGIVSSPKSASATYSAYTNREKDWQQRGDAGEINFVSARDLRAELRAIVPQNSESSKIFCPNGPSSNVSPLMENKCGDRLAAPSVFGRQQDIVGNSIPGFAPGYTTGGSSNLMADPRVGGMPKY